MPKKSAKDGEGKKNRRTSSSNKDVRGSVASSPSSNEVLLPPTPSATHLIASNPFDDPPTNTTMNNPGALMHGPPVHFPMHNAGIGSPTGVPMGSHGPVPQWNSNPMPTPHRGMRPYGSPGGPAWNTNSGEMISPGNTHMISNYPPMSMQGMSPNGYSYNRSMMSHPGLGPHQVPYNSPSRMPGNRFGEIPNERMPVPRAPMHMQGLPPHSMAAVNQMKLMRPGAPVTQSVPPPMTSSARKSSTSGKSDLKYSRNDGGSTTPKSKKKGKADSKSKGNTSDIDEKNGKVNLIRTNSKSQLSSPSGNRVTPPHKLPPVLPQVCVQCGQDVNLDESICCLASCNSWYHRTCAGLTIEAFECLRSEELALWACDNCLKTKHIHSIRIREPIHTESNNMPITGKV